MAFYLLFGALAGMFLVAIPITVILLHRINENLKKWRKM